MAARIPSPHLQPQRLHDEFWKGVLPSNIAGFANGALSQWVCRTIKKAPNMLSCNLARLGKAGVVGGGVVLPIFHANTMLA